MRNFLLYGVNGEILMHFKCFFHLVIRLKCQTLKYYFCIASVQIIVALRWRFFHGQKVYKVQMIWPLKVSEQSSSSA